MFNDIILGGASDQWCRKLDEIGVECGEGGLAKFYFVLLIPELEPVTE